MNESKKRGQKMRRKGFGTAEWRDGHWYARVSLPDGTRPRYRLCKDGECACRGMSDAMRDNKVEKISARERARVQVEVDQVESDRKSRRLTVQTFGELWTNGTLYERHGNVNRLRPKASASEDMYRLKAYVYPLIGSMPVASVTELEIERVMAKAPKEWRAATRMQLYQVIRRLFDLAIMPGRLRSDSPVSRYLRPSGDDDERLYGYLYPDELLALLRHREGANAIPTGRRVLYALAVYTGLRKSTLYKLAWSGFDSNHGTLTYLASQNKTRVARTFFLEFGAAELLRAWHELSGRPAPERPIIAGVDMDKGREAEALRGDLRAAGVKRSLLFSEEDGNEPVRFHDLRATFCTWAKRLGKSDGWITDRAGWVEPRMMARYSRQSRTLEDLQIVPFPDVSGAIPELVDVPQNVVPIRERR